MSFAKRNPEVVQATRMYCKALAEIAKPIDDFINQLPTNQEQIYWSLVAEALQQGIGSDWLARLLPDLRNAYLSRIPWHLPVLKTQELDKALAKHPWIHGWSLQPHVEGILLSTGRWARDFETSHPKLDISSEPKEKHWRALSQLYFMGRNSKTRPKVLFTLFRWQAKPPMGLGYSLSMQNHRKEGWPLPVSSGARRWFRLLGPNRMEWLSKQDEKVRLEYYRRLYEMICPGEPEMAVHGLAFFLEPSMGGLLCQQAFVGCTHCPLATMSPLSGQCPRRQV